MVSLLLYLCFAFVLGAVLVVNFALWILFFAIFSALSEAASRLLLSSTAFEYWMSLVYCWFVDTILLVTLLFIVVWRSLALFGG